MFMPLVCKHFEHLTGLSCGFHISSCVSMSLFLHLYLLQGEGVGYFKLQLDPTSSSQASGNSNNSSGSSSGDRVLLVAFGSAPGLPNWGGIVAKVAAAAESPEEQ